MRRLHLVRHGRSAVDRDVAAHEWDLAPGGYPSVDALRESAGLPANAVWYSSTETKALETARALTASTVSVVPALREHERNTTHWFAEPAEFCEVVHRGSSATTTLSASAGRHTLWLLSRPIRMTSGEVGQWCGYV